MLSEFFSVLEIDDVQHEELPLCKPEEFQPLLHSKNWFLQQQHRETLFHRACHAYHISDYREAYKLFKEELAIGEHNRVHKVGLYESIIRSGLKINPLPDDIEVILYAYENIVTEYGEQLQYWNSAILVIKNFPARTLEYIKLVAMLCATVDSPDHWRYFGLNPHIRGGPNYNMAFLTRILTLLECNLEYAVGFVADRVIQTIEETKTAISDLNEPKEKEVLAKTQMVNDCLRADKLRELGSDVKRPAHDCKCKIGVFKTKEQINSIFEEFTIRYKWMFTGMFL